MDIPHADMVSTPMRPFDSLVWLYPTPQAELDALDTLWQHYHAGVLTLDEALRTMEGRQLWQVPALQVVR